MVQTGSRDGSERVHGSEFRVGKWRGRSPGGVFLMSEVTLYGGFREGLGRMHGGVKTVS